MNREKYIKDKSYREGYGEGRKEGIDAVINTYNAYLNRLEEDINYLYANCDDCAIANAPTIEPVKHGEWELEMDWNIPAWRCSECGFVTNYIREEADSLGNNPMNLAGSNFCPNCGARMIGGEDE